MSRELGSEAVRFFSLQRSVQGTVRYSTISAWSKPCRGAVSSVPPLPGFQIGSGNHDSVIALPPEGAAATMVDRKKRGSLSCSHCSHLVAETIITPPAGTGAHEPPWPPRCDRARLWFVSFSSSWGIFCCWLSSCGFLMGGKNGYQSMDADAISNATLQTIIGVSVSFLMYAYIDQSVRRPPTFQDTQHRGI